MTESTAAESATSCLELVSSCLALRPVFQGLRGDLTAGACRDLRLGKSRELPAVPPKAAPTAIHDMYTYMYVMYVYI